MRDGVKPGTAGIGFLADEIRISHTEHAIAGVIAVAAMARAAVKALPGVVEHEVEEGLLRRVVPRVPSAPCPTQSGASASVCCVKGELFKGNLVNLKTGLAKGFQPPAVTLLVTGKRAAKLAVNIVNHARVRGARGVVTRNDLFAYRDQQPAFGIREESERGGAVRPQWARPAEAPAPTAAPKAPTAASFSAVRREMPAPPMPIIESWLASFIIALSSFS